MDALSQLVEQLAATPWALMLVVGLAALDTYMPLLPSETAITALASIAVTTGTPHPLLLILTGMTGAMLGDLSAFWLGRLLGVERRWMRGPRIRRVIRVARITLRRRPGVLIITARYIPGGRAAVNMTAGATGFRLARFVAFDAIATLSWASVYTLIGLLAGAAVRDQPLLGAAIAVASAMVLGVLVDQIVRWRDRRAARARDAARLPQPAP